MANSLRIATFNVLADAYTEYGDYHHAPAHLMRAGHRTQPLVSLVNRLGADVVGLQEAEEPLAEAFATTGVWHTFWHKKRKENAPDGCLTLVRKGLAVTALDTISYSDESGHLAQIVTVGNVAIANTHIKWEMPNRIAQTGELLARVATKPHVVLVGDFNDRPGGPARRMTDDAGFDNLLGEAPTAFIANREGPASLDLLAVRGLEAKRVPITFGEGFDIEEIPSALCPSDHIPAMAEIALP